MMHLIWSRDEANDESRKTIKELVVNAYKEMFFSPDQDLPDKAQIKEIANALLR
jgi:hypothetical protein